MPNLAQSVLQAVRASIGADRRFKSAPPQQEAVVQEWVRSFADLFDEPPSAEQRTHLEWLASDGAELSARQRCRRILAAFDQQVVRTAFTVRWDADDVELRTIEEFSMYLDRADVSVANVIAAQAYEPHLIAFFKAFLRRGMHFIDAGANIGLYSLLSASLVGPSGKVWSFEPNTENCRLLLASALRNGFGQIELHPVALGNERGYAHFTSALGSNGGIQEDAKHDLLGPSCRIVPLARLDDLHIGQADLMKMDVEGAEAMLLLGAQETIRRCRPVIVSEFSDEMLGRISGWRGGRFIEFAENLGYTSLICDKATHQVRRLEDPQAFAAAFIGTGRIEDLVFCPDEKLELVLSAR